MSGGFLGFGFFGLVLAAGETRARCEIPKLARSLNQNTMLADRASLLSNRFSLNVSDGDDTVSDELRKEG